MNLIVDWFHEIASAITKQHVFNFMTAILLMVIGMFLSRRVENLTGRVSHLEPQQRLLFNKIGKYGIISLACAAALSQIGFDLRVLLGAAGILTVAIGFAAQTSASNLISGFFLMIERPFTLGDVVQLGGTDIRGVVISIDLLSTKIRTFSQLMIRIPNETMVKSTITNFSFFPVRRVDFSLSVDYKSDLVLVEETLRRVATIHPLCLEEPGPEFTTVAFGDSAIQLSFYVYTMTENIAILQNDLYRQIKDAFSEKGIEMPFPMRTVLLKRDELLEPGPAQVV